jgi:hypothetical protein
MVSSRDTFDPGFSPSDLRCSSSLTGERCRLLFWAALKKHVRFLSVIGGE